ncbi:Uu.00g127890.m01.CDS01 [Anthostomella pinea]|uniref:Uu.00g127890.m01.CDS01 n=1 Tax=Anthostomella pinea TaxID=933095 RepID=A0AAI8VJ57_9PEZI|nr:Uu.00g127890.m01.CDS01 [Anthostomella pinea]
MTGDTPLGLHLVVSETPPGGDTTPLTVDASDEYLDEIVETRATSIFHGSGSCAMGSVVDSELRVKGVQNLRIVDASVFPVSIGRHLQAATYALAEQAADIISKDKTIPSRGG